MKLNRSGLLLLAAALLLVGVGVWYVFLRKKPETSGTGITPPTGDSAQPTTPAPSSYQPTGSFPADQVTFEPGVDDDPNNPVRINVETSWTPQSGQLRVGSATDVGLLNLVLYGNRLSGNKGQLRNVAGPGDNVRYMVDWILPWRESIDALWFGTDWPHVIEAWDIDPTTDPGTWRRDGIRHGQTVFTLKTGTGNYES